MTVSDQGGRERGSEVLVERLREKFPHRFHKQPRVFFAPGRVNLIGAHLDYNGGAVLPVSTCRGTYVAIAPSEEPRIRLASLDVPESFDISVDRLPPPGELGWAAYVVGVWIEACRRGIASDSVGFDVCVAGDLPRGAGLSSSASLEVATGIGLCEIFDWGLTPLQIAELAWTVETEFVGVKCGIMDQFASALGREGHALHLECLDRRSRHVPVHGELELMVIDSRKPRELVDSAFNERVEQCRQAFALLSSLHPGRRCLAEFRLEEVEAARDRLGAPRYERARHVATEVERIENAVAALERGDFAALGRLLCASHKSTSVDYEVSCAELDFIVDRVCEIDGVYGARLTGAGFGGCVIALCVPGAVGERESTGFCAAYEQRFGWAPELFSLQIGASPREATR